jgi:tetratricopeptide (TPR) repeat protein
MKRPPRNLLIILTALAVAWLVLRMLLPLIEALWAAAGLLALGLILVVWGRDFVIGRYRMRRRDWQRALERFKRFEHKLLDNPLSALLMPLYVGIYSFDGVAIARNNIGVCLINLTEMDQAVRWFRAALQRDPLYPVPYINLATIAATRNDAATIQREIRRAVELGYSPAGAQLLLRRLLARANESAERRLD